MAVFPSIMDAHWSTRNKTSPSPVSNRRGGGIFSFCRLYTNQKAKSPLLSKYSREKPSYGPRTINYPTKCQGQDGRGHEAHLRRDRRFLPVRGAVSMAAGDQIWRQVKQGPPREVFPALWRALPFSLPPIPPQRSRSFPGLTMRSQVLQSAIFSCIMQTAYRFVGVELRFRHPAS